MCMCKFLFIISRIASLEGTRHYSIIMPGVILAYSIFNMLHNSVNIGIRDLGLYAFSKV